jgi:hypothetical protein
MHVAIDDTYGPIDATPSTYVTGARRTSVAVEFADSDVEDIRCGVRECIVELRSIVGDGLKEFHFADIYNCTGVWSGHRGLNLRIFEFFAKMYGEYHWRVHVQTVDERTLADHDTKFTGAKDELDLDRREDQALFMLLVKLKHRLPQPPAQLVLLADAGRRKPGSSLAPSIFREWEDGYVGRYAASQDEPLIQIADFFAYTINRCTHLTMKEERSDHDIGFLRLMGSMRVISDDLVEASFPEKFSSADVDAIHREDRRRKGLE